MSILLDNEELTIDICATCDLSQIAINEHASDAECRRCQSALNTVAKNQLRKVDKEMDSARGKKPLDRLAAYDELMASIRALTQDTPASA